MSKFNGHKNWNHWNVSLWINNDEGLYHMAQEAVRCAPNRALAAKRMHIELVTTGNGVTPDGAPYTPTTIRAAMVGI